VPADTNTLTKSDQVDEASQTRRDFGNSPDQAYSLNKMAAVPDLKEPLGLCPNEIKEDHQECSKLDSRNPITGLGLNGDGVGGLKPKKLKIRGGRLVLVAASYTYKKISNPTSLASPLSIFYLAL